MKAMILAAGLGTRLRPITERYAKPAVPFLNIPLLYYSLSLMEQAGKIDGLVLNTHHHPEQIEALASRLKDFDVAFSNEPGTPLGSGGGIWKARKLLEGGGSFVVANGDEVILPHNPKIMREFLTKHEKSGALATILVMKHPLVGTQFGGVWADNDGRVRGFGKDGSKFGTDVTGYHYIGLLLLSDRVFNYLPAGESNILYDALATGIANHEKVEVLVDSFTWFETGNPKDFLHATDEALDLLAHGKGEDAKCLREICERYWTEKMDLKVDGASRLLISKKARIHETASLRGFAVISDGATIGRNAQVENAVVLPGAAALEAAIVRHEIKF